MQYLFLLYGDEAADAALTPAEQREIVDRHVEFSRDLRDRGVLHGGEALRPSTNARVLRVARGAVTDGPFAETKEQLGGYYRMECANEEEALDVARRIPPSPGLAIEIRPVAAV